MAYDSARRRTVLFGGIETSRYADTWEWSGSAWAGGPTTVAPSARYGAMMVFDAARSRMVLFGGTFYENSSTYADTWEYGP